MINLGQKWAKNGQFSGNINPKDVIFYYCGNKYEVYCIYFPPCFEPWPAPPGLLILTIFVAFKIFFTITNNLDIINNINIYQGGIKGAN